MIQANELRIGNLVSIDCTCCRIITTEILSIESDEINVCETCLKCGLEYWNMNPNLINPIPLTEEFKIQFGNDKLVLVDKLGFVIFKNGYAYQFVFEDYTYIHSIQNLYFALTGEELILK